MTENRARALKDSAILELKAALDGAATPSDFLAAADMIVQAPANLLEMPFDTGEPDPLTPGLPSETGRDVDNAPLVYEFIGALDRSNASDRRLWTCLAFSAYRPYMEARWPLDGIDNWKGRVEDRWLMLNASRGPLIRHGISRLWWVASLTFDAKRKGSLSQDSDDQFAYTRAAFRNEDRINALFDREAGSIPLLVQAVLESAAVSAAAARDSYVRALMKEVTLVYGYRDIEILGAGEMRSLIGDLAATAQTLADAS